MTYILDPNHLWYPDLEDIENHIKYNPAVAGILIINPDNPTGAVYPAHILRDIVAIAEKNDLFIICDEVYQNMTYNGTTATPMATVIGNKVPAICMRGISKEMPWPGSRCGWIEVYNGHRDPMFEKYINSILNAKMVEVCSTTLPQTVLPRIQTHPQYPVYLGERIRSYERCSNIAYDILKDHTPYDTMESVHDQGGVMEQIATMALIAALETTLDAPAIYVSPPSRSAER